jgi:hypothetical protein
MRRDMPVRAAWLLPYITQELPEMTGLADVRIEDWNRLQRQVGWLRAGLLILLLLIVALAITLFARQPGSPATSSVRRAS